MKRRCECTQGYCCDRCWRLAAKDDPCRKVPACENPAGHVGKCGPFKNTQSVVVTAADLMPRRR